MTGSLSPTAVPAQWYLPDPPKSAVAAVLLQRFFGWFGLGRFYVGSAGIAFTQLALAFWVSPPSSSSSVSSSSFLDIHRSDPDVLGQREGQRRAQTSMISPRAFLGVIGAFTNVFGSKSANATVADQRNEMGRNLTGEGDTYPDRDYVAECREAKRMHQASAIPLAIVGGALLLGAALARPRDRGSTS